jgi:hypothetical protein
MAGKDIIMVRQKDLKRLHVIHKVIEGALTQAQAAEMTMPCSLSIDFIPDFFLILFIE